MVEVDDKMFLSLIDCWLKAGILERDGTVIHPHTGIPRVWRRTARKKLRAGFKACRDWVKSHRHLPLKELIPKMIRKVRGHYNYFRAAGNINSLWIFYREAVGTLYKWLNRRSQRRSLTWPGLKRMLDAYNFPTPDKRPIFQKPVADSINCLAASVSIAEEPCAGIPLAGICAGGIG